MADYYPLISRSIESLASSTPESRQRVYDHAKHALVEQLRLLDPPIPEIDIMRERLALESAIRKFERTCIATKTEATPDLSESQQDDRLDRPEQQIFSENFQTVTVESARDELVLPIEVSDDTGLDPHELTKGDIQTVENPQSIKIVPDQTEEKTEEINLYVGNLKNKQIIFKTIFKNIFANKYFYRAIFIVVVLSTLSFSILQIAQFLETNQSNIDAQNAQSKGDVAIEIDKIEEKAPVIAFDQKDIQTDLAKKNENTDSSQSNNSASILPNVEQRAVFFAEASETNADPVRFEGQVIWKLETFPSSVDGVSDTGARATIAIKDIGLTADIVIRQNKDQDSANSHMIEVKFATDALSERGKVRDIGVPELRAEENLRGVQLAGIPVPVTGNIFLIGMNGLPVESQKNLELLRKMNWTLLPIRFENGNRAALLFEKGKTGNRVIEDTLQTWK